MKKETWKLINKACTFIVYTFVLLEIALAIGATYNYMLESMLIELAKGILVILGGPALFSAIFMDAYHVQFELDDYGEEIEKEGF